jgi:hypothetical protein
VRRAGAGHCPPGALAFWPAAPAGGRNPAAPKAWPCCGRWPQAASQRRRPRPAGQTPGRPALALDLAGRYLDDRHHSLGVDEYLQEIARAGALAHESQQDWSRYNPTRHATSLEATFRVSWKALCPPSPPAPPPDAASAGRGVGGEGDPSTLAQALFRLAGWCAPGVSIPRCCGGRNTEATPEGPQP